MYTKLYCNSNIIVNTRKTKTEEILVSKGVRQGRNSQLTKFNNYTDDIIQAWGRNITSGIKPNGNIILDNLLYVDDTVLIRYTEDELQVFTSFKAYLESVRLKNIRGKNKRYGFLGKVPSQINNSP